MTGSIAVAIAACLNSTNQDHVSTTRLNTVTTLKRMVDEKVTERKQGGDHTPLSIPAFISGIQADLRQFGLNLKGVYGYVEDTLKLYAYVAVALHDKTIKVVQDMYNEEVCHSLCVSLWVCVCVYACVWVSVRL